MHSRTTILLLNVAHAVDHMFLLIFATAVTTIAADFGLARWEDLMPFGVGAFVMFGLGSLPAGRLGDLWGRRSMMIIFFFGMGLSSLLAAITQGPWQLAAALTLIGVFASIYHPVGIPMLLQAAVRPGATIGINGLAGNLLFFRLCLPAHRMETARHPRLCRRTATDRSKADWCQGAPDPRPTRALPCC